MTESKRRGRPPMEPGKAKRASFNTRIRSALKAQLEGAANIAGRSLSEEIEFRLERSLEEQKRSDDTLQEGIAIGAYFTLALVMGRQAQAAFGIPASRKMAPAQETLEKALDLARQENWGAGTDNIGNRLLKLLSSAESFVGAVGEQAVASRQPKRE